MKPRPETGGPARFQYTQVHMGVPVRIVLYAPEAVVAERAATAAFRRFADLEQVMSDYRPTSELMRLCDHAGETAPVPVSSDLWRLLERAERVSRESDGAFDVTVGPFVALWRRARKTGALPTRVELREAAARIGWQKVRLNGPNRTVHLLVPGMRLDLGGIAKGDACDQAQQVLKRNGVSRALIEAGGDIVVTGAPPGAGGWKIAIANAPAGTGLTLADAAVSSSGDTEQFVTFAGRRYSHIVDPATGLGLTDRVAATVIAPDGLTSDSLSTALCVLGRVRGEALVRRLYPGVRAFLRAPRRAPRSASPTPI